MLLKISDIDSWKNFFDLIHDSTTVVELKLDQEKCGMSLLNNSHVCFYMVEYARDFFDEYQVDGAESVLLFTSDFYNIIKTAKKNDELEISNDDALLKIVLEHDANRRVFEIPLAEDYGDSPTPPSIPYNGEVSVSLKDLKQPCVDLDKIVGTDKFKMKLDDGLLSILSPNDTMTRYTQTIEVDTSLNEESIVNLNYILDLQKLSKIDDTVTFKVGTDMPLTWNVTSPDEFVKVSGLIAPILEEDD